MGEELLAFASDYMEGAHPRILNRLVETNMEHSSGYGTDEHTQMARNFIKRACVCPNAQVQILTGGTQINATVIDCLLKKWQGVISADSGHINVHEAGAIEFTGHKVLPLKSDDGKLSAQSIENYLKDFYNDGNWTHMVEPGMVYISQPTEMGTLYSLKELSDISRVCRQRKIPLYVDGARLAYALGSSENDVGLEDLGRLADAFYIGGTKCGALFGEALVLPDPELIPHCVTQIKQHGALMAKGRIAGLQFEEFFKDGLYFGIGKQADSYADQIRKALEDAGYQLYCKNSTNQVFFIIENSKLASLEKKVMYSFWEKYDDEHTVIRFATSWATSQDDVETLLQIIKEL